VCRKARTTSGRVVAAGPFPYACLRLRLHLDRTLQSLPIDFALTGVKADDDKNKTACVTPPVSARVGRGRGSLCPSAIAPSSRHPTRL